MACIQVAMLVLSCTVCYSRYLNTTEHGYQPINNGSNQAVSNSTLNTSPSHMELQVTAVPPTVYDKTIYFEEDIKNKFSNTTRTENLTTALSNATQTTPPITTDLPNNVFKNNTTYVFNGSEYTSGNSTHWIGGSSKNHVENFTIPSTNTPMDLKYVIKGITEKEVATPQQETSTEQYPFTENVTKLSQATQENDTSDAFEMHSDSSLVNSGNISVLDIPTNVTFERKLTESDSELVFENVPELIIATSQNDTLVLSSTLSLNSRDSKNDSLEVEIIKGRASVENLTQGINLSSAVSKNISTERTVLEEDSIPLKESISSKSTKVVPPSHTLKKQSNEMMIQNLLLDGLKHNSWDRQVPIEDGPFGSLIWRDRKYLISVLVPIGVGITGAVAIVVVAYFVRSYKRKLKRRAFTSPSRIFRPQAQLAIMDNVLLLDDSSDDGF